jgi:nitrous oxidase accessory protein NosD
MRSRWLLLGSLAAIVVFAALSWPDIHAQPAPAPRLAGARPTIKAEDFASLQAAIDALPTEGGVVQLPAGRFEIAEPLVIETPDVLFMGQGTATHIVNTNTTGKSALVVRPKDHATNAKAFLWRVQLQNLRITGSEKSGHGIEALRVNEIFIDGVTVSYHGGDGIRLDRCYEDPRVVNSLITYNKHTGLEILGCHDVVVAANHFEENRDALRCLDGFNLCMAGNNVDDHLRHGVVIENTYGSVLSGNMIEECQGTGVILDRDCYGVTLSANVIAHEFSGGIDLRDAHGCTVSGNSFPLVWKNALVIGPKSGRITVTGNTFSDSYIGDGQRKREVSKEPSSGITLAGTSDIVISGNTFSGLSTKALTLEGEPSSRLTFIGNVLVGIDSDHDRLVDSQVANNVTK